MASKIGAAMAGGGNENGGTVDAAAASSGEAEEEKEDDGHAHGGGGIFQKFMSSSYAPSRDSGGSETDEVEGEENGQGAGDEQGGILSAMASRIGMAMSGANGNGNGHHHSAADDAKTNDDVDRSKGEEEEDEANGAGILSTMASKIGVAMSSANGNGGDHGTVGGAEMSNGDAVDHVNGDQKEKGDDDPNGGILGAMASKIGMAMSGANGDGNHGGSGDDGKTNDGDASGSGRVEEKGGGANGGGLVDHIRGSGVRSR